MENKILASLVWNRENYNRLRQYISEEDLSPNGGILMEYIDAYYERDPEAREVDLEILSSSLEREYPKKAEILIDTIKRAEDTSFENLYREFLEFKVHTTELRLADALVGGRREDFEALYKQYEALRAGEPLSQEQQEELYLAPSVGEIVEHSRPEGLIGMAPSFLNERLEGGCYPGHQIIIFARPETGKTAFAIQQAVYWTGGGRKVLYFANEEPANQLLIRFLACYTGKRKMEILKNPAEIDYEARTMGYENLILASAHPGTFRQLRGLIQNHQPDIVILDQMRNLRTRAASRVEQLEQIAYEMRNIAKEYGTLMVGLTQAGDSGENKLVLEMGDVDFSNTGIPAQADLMIGLGSNEGYRTTGKVMVNLPKNKISGVHEFFPLRVDHTVSRFYDLT